MGTWRPTAADRGPDGKLLLEPLPDNLINQSLADVGAGVEATPPANGEAPPAASPPLPRRFPAAPAAALLAIGALILLIASSRATPAAEEAVPLPIARTTAAPPSPSPAAPAPRYIVAYWAPDGAAVPQPIREEDAYHFTGRQGADWAQVELPGGGLVWVRRADLALDPDDLAALTAAPDLTPPTPAPIVIAPPPAPAVVAAPPTAAPPLAVPPMRFPVDAPAALPSPRRVHEKPVSKPPPGTRPYGDPGPLQPPAAYDQPLYGEMPMEAPGPARRAP